MNRFDSPFQTWKTLDAQGQLIRVQWVLLGLLAVICLMILWTLKSESQTQRVFITPQLLKAGGHVTSHLIPKETVYAFAFEIFSGIHSWEHDGATDYPHNIARYRAYLSPRFHAKLLGDVKHRQSQSALHRVRLVSNASTEGFSPERVKVIGTGVWDVTLTLDVMETVTDKVVKHVLLQYVVRVRRIQSPISVNPWGLVLADTVGTPHRLQTLLTP